MAPPRAGLPVILVFFCCALLSAQTATIPQSSPAGQIRQSQTDKPTVLKVTTRLVVTDIVATDSRGRAVTDLKAQDFKLLEDDKQQEVRIFNLRRPHLIEASSQPETKLPANVFTNIPTYRRDTSLNVILVDLLNTDFKDQAYARQKVLKYLASIPDDQPIAVAVYALGRKLHLIQDFTSDFAALRNAINGVKEQLPFLENPAAGASPDAKDLVPASTGAPTTAHELLDNFSRMYEGSEQLDRRVEYTLQAMRSLARKLSGYSGRKNLIWISSSFPIGVYPHFDQGIREFDVIRSYEEDVFAAAQAMIDAHIAVYPVDPRGPLGVSRYGGSATAENDFVTLLMNESAAGESEQSTMQQMAYLTGGKVYYNQNNIDDAIRSSIDDGSTYYTLAYYPDNKDWNGRFRKITVKVDRPGIKLRYRGGYYALNAASDPGSTRMFAAFGQALNLDSPISTGLRFEVGVVQPSDKTDNKVLLNFALDPRVVNFEKQDDGFQHAKVDCVVQAYTDSGHLVKADANTLTVTLDPPTFSKTMQNFLLAHVFVDLPPGSYLLRFGVMDEHTGLIGTTNARVTINPQATESKGEEKK